MYGGFRSLIPRTAELHDIDYVIVDFGPFSGLMNRTFIMSCDYILPSVFADQYSLQAIHTLLTHVLPGWMSWRNKWVQESDKELAANNILTFKYPTSPPKILPFLVTNYKIKKLGNMRVNKDSSRWIWAMEDYLGVIYVCIPINFLPI